MQATEVLGLFFPGAVLAALQGLSTDLIKKKKKNPCSVG